MSDTFKIKLRRGILTLLPGLLDAGEPGFTTDTGEIFVGNGVKNHNITDKARVFVPIDWSDKQAGLPFIEKVSGAGIVSYNSTESAMGKGCYSASGDGSWQIKRMYPVSPLIGIGGHVVLKGSMLASVGCKFYDQDGTELAATAAQAGFIANGQPVGTSFTMYKGWLQGEGAGATQFPTGTRFIRPYFTLSSVTSARVDAFIVYPMSFAMTSLYV